RARGVALLGIVVSATTFVALLAIIAILSATRLMEDLIRGSLNVIRVAGLYVLSRDEQAGKTERRS
ncbi:MAG: hypothetical protein ACOY9D_12600, partial [Pseudomonadota bacterium]